jgi:hypothetical protein
VVDWSVHDPNKEELNEDAARSPLRTGPHSSKLRFAEKRVFGLNAVLIIYRAFVAVNSYFRLAD